MLPSVVDTAVKGKRIDLVVIMGGHVHEWALAGHNSFWQWQIFMVLYATSMACLVDLTLHEHASAACSFLVTCRYEKTAFQQEVQRGFDALQDNSWVVLDASKSIEALQTEVSHLW